MPSVIKTVNVSVPVRTAYNQWTQFETFPQFMGGVESITQTDDTHSHWVTKIGGVTREFVPRSPSSTRTSGSRGRAPTARPRPAW